MKYKTCLKAATEIDRVVRPGLVSDILDNVGENGYFVRVRPEDGSDRHWVVEKCKEGWTVTGIDGDKSDTKTGPTLLAALAAAGLTS